MLRISGALSKAGNPKLAANLVMGDVNKYLNSKNVRFQDSKITAAHFATLVKLQENKVISSRATKDLVADLMEGADPEVLVEER